ncbi:MAG: DUF378 domain-containing protein [Bacilli bacterium]
MFKLSIFDKISFFLVLLGSLNFGIMGLFNLNFLGLVVGGSDILIRIIYIAIFVGALDLIYLIVKCKTFK